MTRRQALAQLLLEIREDVAAYQRLRGLLASQFDAALAHDTPRMTQVGEDIAAIADGLQAHREQRVRLVAQWLGDGVKPSVRALAAMLPEPARHALESDWKELEALVRECKALNLRNCELIVEQQALMQRVLRGEEHTYVSA